MNRRRVLALLGTAALPTVSGCSAFTEQAAHTVNVYDSDPPHNVTVTVLDENDEQLYEETYEFNESDSADENGRFAVGPDPQTVIVTVEGEQYEEPWPTPECSGPNHAALEVRVSFTGDGPLYVGGFCESASME